MAPPCGHRRRARIQRLEFELMSAEEVRNRSVVQITNPTLDNRGIPAVAGVNDLRMGSTDYRLRCETCTKPTQTCFGHFGHIELAEPVFHMLTHTHAFKLLQSVCYFCSNPRVQLTDRAAQRIQRKFHRRPAERFVAMHKLCRTRHVCTHCGSPQPTFTNPLSNHHGRAAAKPTSSSNSSSGGSGNQSQRRKPFARVDLLFGRTWSARARFVCDAQRVEAHKPFRPNTVLRIFCNVPPAARRALGVPHPERLLLRVFLVPPPIIRPQVAFAIGSRTKANSDLTRILQEMVKLNEALWNHKAQACAEGRAAWNPDLWQRLQYIAAVFMRNDRNGVQVMCHRSKVPVRDLSSRLGGKTGRVRGNMMGKRVNNSGRAVITPSPLLPVHEVEIPEAMAMSLTVEEPVTSLNVEDLQRRVDRGATLHGALFVKHDGKTVDVSAVASRHGWSGRLRLLPDRGWAVVRPLKDGDVVVMNRNPSLHMYSLMAHRARIRHSGASTGTTDAAVHAIGVPMPTTQPYNADFDGDEMNVHVVKHLDARADARVLMAVDGTHMLSASKNRPTMGLVQDSMVAAYRLSDPALRISRRLWSRLQAEADTFGLVHASDSDNGDKEGVPGRWVLDLALQTVAPQSRAWDWTSQDKAVAIRGARWTKGRATSAILGTAPHGLLHHVALRFGCKPLADFLSVLQNVLCTYMMLAGASFSLRDICPTASATSILDITLACVAQHGAADDPHARRLLMQAALLHGRQRYDPTTQFAHMIEAGAKGSRVTAGQMMGTVGLQSTAVARCARLHGACVLSVLPPCLEARRAEPRAFGFVRASYLDGLDPVEAFWNAMSGREGLVDTAVKTSRTGYIQRRLVKTLESLKVEQDGSVHNAERYVVQFRYGTDGLAPEWLCSHTVAALDAMPPSSPSALRSLFCVARARMRLGARDLTARVQVPFEAALLACDETVASTRAAAHAPAAAILRRWLRHGWNACVLAAAPVLARRPDLGEVFDRRVERARVPAGEMVGVRASQAASEPAMQMTLNTIHSDGSEEYSVTQGVPRLVELIDLKPHPQTVVAQVFAREQKEAPKDEEEDDKAALARFAEQFRSTRLDDVVCARAVVGNTCVLTLRQPCAAEAAAALNRVLGSACSSPAFVLEGSSNTRVQLGIGDYAVDVDRLCRSAWLGPGPAFVHGVQAATEPGDPCLLFVHSTAPSGHHAEPGWLRRRRQAAHDNTADSSAGIFHRLLQVPGHDWRRAVINDVHQVVQVLGIEAGAAMLFRELRTVYTNSGATVDARHLMLLVDTMMFRGYPVAVTRHDVKHLDTGVLLKTSFEECVSEFTHAVVHGMHDPVEDMTSNVVLGQPFHGGSGLVHLRARHDDKETPALAPAATSITRRGDDEDGSHAPPASVVVVDTRETVRTLISFCSHTEASAATATRKERSSSASTLHAPTSASSSVSSVLLVPASSSSSAARKKTLGSTPFVRSAYNKRSSTRNAVRSCRTRLHVSREVVLADVPPPPPPRSNNQAGHTTPRRHASAPAQTLHAAVANTRRRIATGPVHGQPPPKRRRLADSFFRTFFPDDATLFRPRVRPTQYTPQSPTRYMPQSPTYTPQSPTYTPQSPTRYMPQSPTRYTPQSPTRYTPQSPTYMPQSPTYTPQSPTRYTPQSPQSHKMDHDASMQVAIWRMQKTTNFDGTRSQHAAEYDPTRPALF